jgi:hypothetical protein
VSTDQRFDDAARLEAAELADGEALHDRLRTVHELVELGQVGAIERLVLQQPDGGSDDAGLVLVPEQRQQHIDLALAERLAAQALAERGERVGVDDVRLAVVQHREQRLASLGIAERAEQFGGGDETGAMALRRGRERLAAAEEVGTLAFAQRGHDGDQGVAGRAVGVEVVARHQLEEDVERGGVAHLGAQLDDRHHAPARRLGEALAHGRDGGRAVRGEQRDGALADRLLLGVEQRHDRRDRLRGLDPLEVGESDLAYQNVGAGHRRRHRPSHPLLVASELREHNQRRATRLDMVPFDEPDKALGVASIGDG